jgi:hypothetical protein
MTFGRARQLVAWLLVAGCNSAVCAAGRLLNQTYARETLWIVAEYRSSGVWGSLLAANLLVGWWLWRCSKRGGALLVCTLTAIAVTFPLGLELGMGVYYQQVTGELRIAEFVFTRTALDFPASPDGVCVRAKVDDPWIWKLNEHRVYPRLLPLPLDDAKLRLRLLHPGECSR